MRRTMGIRQQTSEPLVADGWSGRLLRLLAACPTCGTRPALRITAEIVLDMQHHPPDRPLSTYQCHRRGCGHVYALTARAYQEAS
jgi:hypothetical protein